MSTLKDAPLLELGSKTNAKIHLLSQFFETADDKDKVWLIALFTGRRPKKIVSSSLLKLWCAEIAQIPDWLFDECYNTVGDLAETIALLLPPIENENKEYGLSYYIESLISLEQQSEEAKKAFIIQCWLQLQQDERFLFNKLITGGFRVGVSQKTIVNALSKATNISSSQIAHQISGKWNPITTTFKALIQPDTALQDFSKPYPFYLSYPIDGKVQDLGVESEWQAEWKWDGIRGQIIKRNNELFVWSRGEELITNKFPEYNQWKDFLPNGVVLDGEIICLQSNDANAPMPFTPLPFNLLQTRIGRKTITKKQLKEAPVGFIVYDILEYEHQDIRQLPLTQRRSILESIHSTLHQLLQNEKNSAESLDISFYLSPVILFQTWEQLEAIRSTARTNKTEGIMLKRKSSPYQVGRKVGDWWKWKLNPLTIDAVLIYAQKGHGRRSNLYSDYTFALKDGDKLVSFAKAYSGLTDNEIKEVDAFVKANGLEKFGPVRTVKPELVFELAFEGLSLSPRHKSGIAVRFPRINRWRKDKTVAEINTTDDLKLLLHQNL